MHWDDGYNATKLEAWKRDFQGFIFFLSIENNNE